MNQLDVLDNQLMSSARPFGIDGELRAVTTTSLMPSVHVITMVCLVS